MSQIMNVQHILSNIVANRFKPFPAISSFPPLDIVANRFKPFPAMSIDLGANRLKPFAAIGSWHETVSGYSFEIVSNSFKQFHPYWQLPIDANRLKPFAAIFQEIAANRLKPFAAIYTPFTTIASNR